MPDFGQRPIHSQGTHRAQLLQGRLHRQPRIDQHVMDVHAEDLLHTLLAVGLLHRALILERVRVLRAQPHVAGQNAVAVGVVERLEGVPFVDGHGREGRQHVIGQRRLAGLLLDGELHVASGAAGRLVRHRGMQGVELVLQEDLPVRVLNHAEAVGHHFHLALRRAVAHVVEGNPRFTQELLQRRPVLGQAREHEAAVPLHAGRRLDVAVRVVAAPARAGVARLHHRDVAQAAIVVEGPGVVGATKELAGVAEAVPTYHRAAVRAAVVEHPHRTVGAAHHHHRLPADLHGVVVARLGYLRLVSAVDPHALVDALHLQLEDVRIGVDLLAHPVGLDELGKIRNALVKHDCLLLDWLWAGQVSGSWPINAL